MDAEHLIVGAGCAGLSLAVRLAARSVRERGRIVIVDPRAQLGGDRTWCSWRGAPHPFASAITHRWSRWRVLADGRVIERGSQSRPYEHVDSSAFVREAREVIERSEGIELRLGVGVDAMHDEGASVRSVTSRGDLRSRVVWDARGGSPDERATSDDVRWVQHFVGWVVRTERPIFEPSVATLMDFGVSQERGPHFVYVLPYARDEALVEDTYFSDTPLPEEAYERTLRAWLEARSAGAFEIVRRERGRIPMSSAEVAPSTSPRIVPIGLRGGAAKPSTGYAFAFIQRQSDALARIVDRGERPPPAIAPHPPVARFFDRVFLAHLRRNPTSGPEVFGSLFERTPPEALVRFLSEEGGLRDHLAVMNGVPRIAVALEALRSRALWLARS